jgi:hypothetical protein
VNGFTDHLYTRLGTTSTYSVIADLHTSQITRAHARSSQSAFTSRFLVMDLNSGGSSAAVVKPLPAGEHCTTELIAPTVVAMTSRHAPHRKHRYSIVAFVSFAAETCLLSRCPETVLLSICCVVSLPLPRNRSTRYNIYGSVVKCVFRVCRCRPPCSGGVCCWSAVSPSPHRPR